MRPASADDRVVTDELQRLAAGLRQADGELKVAEGGRHLYAREHASLEPAPRDLDPNIAPHVREDDQAVHESRGELLHGQRVLCQVDVAGVAAEDELYGTSVFTFLPVLSTTVFFTVCVRPTNAST
ncbi:MAG: hypothetical protein ACLQVI_37260 [Polyangiaceae bacterium]